jgi:hypothetical protein
VKSACERIIEIVFLCFAYKYSSIWCASVALNFLRRLRLCARGYNNTPKGFSCELFAFLELRRVG